MSSAVIWHEIECGGYHADLPFWRELADDHGGPVLDVGAGTGRVALDLARSGHEVVALDSDPDLLQALTRLAELQSIASLVRAVTADARTFAIGRVFPLIIVPMQTIQLLGGPAGRIAFMARARAHLGPGGAVGIAVATEFEPFDTRDGGPAPLPDVGEHEGVLYFSQPVAVRPDGDGYLLERRRETVTAAGERFVEHDRIHLDMLTVPTLRSEANGTGLRGGQICRIPATDDHMPTEVVLFNE